jgi:hypothetical protein
MAQTVTPVRAADIIQPDFWHQYIVENSTALNNFWQSGIVADMSAMLGDALNGASVHMPFWSDLYGSSEIVSDSVNLSVNKVTTSQDVAAKLIRAKVYGGSDLAADLAGSDPMTVIVSRFAEFWNRDLQDVLLAVVAGATGALAAEGTPVNTLDITGATGAAAVFDGESFIDAKFRLGDHESDLAAVVVHSKTYALMQKQDLITFVAVSEQGRPIPTYMGKRVIVDDRMPNDGTNFTTYLFAPGAIGYAEKAPKNPIEAWRDPLSGGGFEYIVQRRMFLLHPRGIKWIGSPALETASNAELATAGNWQRVYQPKNIKLVTFKHKLA